MLKDFFEQLRPVFEKPINCWIFPLNWTEAVCIPVESATSERTFCPLTTQELPKKRHEAGSSEKLPYDALSQIDYGHTGHC